ncbi:unnamed protein product [Camellia sinensis]
MSQNGKLMPNLDQQSTKVLNLTVLQRIDPFVEEILITAAHVTLYEFNIDLSQWSQGCRRLFVCRQEEHSTSVPVYSNEQEKYSYNLVENLLGDFEYEVQVPYLLYRNAAQEVNGIWFYNKQECEEVANIFSRGCLKGLYKKAFGGYSIMQVLVSLVVMPTAIKELFASWDRGCLEGLYKKALGGYSIMQVLVILIAYSKVPPKSNVSPTRSDFEELEAVPTMAVMDGPLEPSSSTTTNVTDVTDDPSFVNFFSYFGLSVDNALLDAAAMIIGNVSNAAMTGQPYQLSAVIPPSRPPSVPPTAPTIQMPSPPLSASTSLMPLLDNPEISNNSNQATNLVKPSSFFSPPPSSSTLVMPPVSPSMPTAPPLQPVASLQRPYGAPLLQPFPPPTPPPSLTPTSVPAANYGPVISRDKVRDAFQILVQDNQFIDMVYQALLNAHNY